MDRAEDPEKMVRQIILEMEEAVQKSIASVAIAAADEKRIERLILGKKNDVDSWQRSALYCG